MQAFKQYPLKLIIFILIWMSPLYLSLLFLNSMGERDSLSDLATHQKQEEFSIVGLVTQSEVLPFKVTALRQRPATVLALGSSRSMQFRDRFFNSSFYNLGRAFTSIHEGEYLVDQILDLKHPPKMVVIGVEYYWFNENTFPIPTAPYEEKPGMSLAKALVTPFDYMMDGKLSPRDFIATCLNPPQSPHKGMRGILKGEGFGPDGSHYYLSLITGQITDFEDRHFKFTKKRIREGIMLFEHGQAASSHHIDTFLELIAKLENKGIDVVLFYPPVAPSIITYLDGFEKEFAYIQDLKTRLQKAGLEIHDFYDPKGLNTSDCEFLDGFHGGDLLYTKLLKELGKRENNLALYLNFKAINAATSSYRNIAFIPDPRLGEIVEQDFLGIKGKCETKAN